MIISDYASSKALRYNGIWRDWRSMSQCRYGGFATSFSQLVESPQGVIDNTALNSICLQCSTGGEVCSKTGYWGSWATSRRSSSGFVGAKLRFEWSQGNGDDTAANELILYNGNTSYRTGNGGVWGDWLDLQRCPSGQRICGLKTRVEKSIGRGDDTALNGVVLQCCKKRKY